VKACQEEDEERRFLRRNPRDYVFEILPLRINESGYRNLFRNSCEEFYRNSVETCGED
jgi:hypothetical protein